MNITAYDLAQRFLGIEEAEGAASNPHILAMLRLDAKWAQGDETPWCSAFVNYIAWLLRLPRSKSLAARSWLMVGRPVPIGAAAPGFTVAVLKRGSGQQPGPEVLAAPGHVGFFGGLENGWVEVTGGNQSDRVTVARFPESSVLGIRSLV